MSKKSIAVIRKRGRPTTGQDPVTALRLSDSLKSSIDNWSKQQEDKPTRSAAIRRLVEFALAVQAKKRVIFYQFIDGNINLKEINSGPPNLITIRQIKAARALLGWSQSDLSRHSGVSEPTIARLESREGKLGGRGETVKKIRAALDASGIEFIDENGGGPGVHLRTRSQATSRK